MDLEPHTLGVYTLGVYTLGVYTLGVYNLGVYTLGVARATDFGSGTANTCRLEEI